MYGFPQGHFSSSNLLYGQIKAVKAVKSSVHLIKCTVDEMAFDQMSIQSNGIYSNITFGQMSNLVK